VTRTAAYKGIYFAMVGAGMAIGLMFAVIAWHSEASTAFALGFVGLILVLLIPGRVLGYFWRDLLAGLRLLNRKDYAASKRHSERFIAAVREKPWLKRLIWLGSSTYSRDPEALALTNLAAAEIGLEAFDDARRHLGDAMALDDKNPLAFHNMGVLCLRTTTRADAEPWFEKARALGFGHGPSDRLVRAAQARFAYTDGKLDKTLLEPSDPRPPAR
jgi:xanthosine utilization system XapX-like protein